MGRLIVLCMMVCCIAIQGFSESIMAINFDYKTEAVVLGNTALMETAELAHSAQIDSVKSRQNKLMKASGILLGIKEEYQKSCENVKGFEREKAVYKQIEKKSLSIVDKVSKATKVISQSKLPGKAMAAISVGDMVIQAGSLVKMFVNIVTNSTVENPMKGVSGVDTDKKTDKHNLLNRYERMSMARDIIKRLDKIELDLIKIIYGCQNANFLDLFRELDYEGYIKYVTAKVNVDYIVSSWKDLSSKKW